MKVNNEVVSPDYKIGKDIRTRPVMGFCYEQNQFSSLPLFPCTFFAMDNIYELCPTGVQLYFVKTEACKNTTGACGHKWAFKKLYV